MNVFAFRLAMLVGGITVSASAAIVSRPVVYEHEGVTLEGTLAYDDAVAPAANRPGVVVIPEWWGLTDYVRDRARQLAELGYVAFAIDMYGKGVLTEDPKKAGELASQFYGKPLMASRARAGLEQLLATKRVDPKQVAVIGYCFGGATAQVLAYSGAPLAGIVSFHGSLVPPSAEQAAATKARLLICHGVADTFVPTADVEAFLKAVEAGQLDYQFVAYAGAVHAFSNPGADGVAARTGLPIAYHAAADRRSWQHMQLFFDEIFGRQSGSNASASGAGR